MPQSKKPKKAYRGPKSQFDLGSLMRDEAKLHVETPDTPTAVGQAAPSAAARPVPSAAPKAARSISGRGALVAAGVGAAGAGAYLAARHRRRNAVSKQLVDPYEDVSKRSAKEHLQRNVYDPRVGVYSRQGRPARKVMRREANRHAARGAAVGGALGAGAGAYAGRRMGSVKGGAILGGLFGSQYGGAVGVLRGRSKGYDKAEREGLLRDRVKKSAPDRVMGFTTPAIGQTRYVSARRPQGSTGSVRRLERTIVRARRSNRDHLGKWTHDTKLKGRGNRLLEVHKAVSGPHGANLPDRVMGPTTPQIGRGVLVAVRKPSGKHISHANDYERFTGLDGNYSGLPKATKHGATTLGHYKKGRDSAARAFVGKALDPESLLTGAKALGRGVKRGTQLGVDAPDASKPFRAGLQVGQNAKGIGAGVLAGGLGTSAFGNRRGRKVTG